MSQQVQRPTPHPSRTPEPPVGKQSLTAAFEGQLADVYESAVASAHREIAAVRNTALPAYLALGDRRDLTPIAFEIESTRIAMQVRYLLTSASRHVRAVESRAHRDPIVRQLRDLLDVQVARATELGVYPSAETQRPVRARMARGTGAPAVARPKTDATRRTASIRPAFHL